MRYLTVLQRMFGFMKRDREERERKKREKEEKEQKRATSKGLTPEELGRLDEAKRAMQKKSGSRPDDGASDISGQDRSSTTSSESTGRLGSPARFGSAKGRSTDAGKTSSG